MKKNSEWLALLPRIQSHSKELESGLARSSTNLVEALAGLDSLEALTQAHLAPPSAAPSPAEKLATHPPVLSAPKTVSKSEYKTQTKEYAPALNQQDLVQALLDYQKRQGVRSPRVISSSPRPQTPAGAPAPRSEFAHALVPEIQADPKASSLKAQRVPGVRIPVLRTRPEGNS